VKRFPCGKYGRQTLHFFPAPFRSPLRAFAGLVFPWQDATVLLANIEGRGWCIPSGRVEPDETSLEAVKREAIEESGAVLGNIQYIGCYSIADRGEQRWADCYAATVDELVEIGMQEESLGRRFASLEELPQMYHLWNELTAQVFAHSKEVIERHLRMRAADVLRGSLPGG
jgi:8-oxo-dGTP diphosphatase